MLQCNYDVYFYAVTSYCSRLDTLSKYFMSRMLMSFEIVLTVCSPSLCCVYTVVIVFLNQIFRGTDCCLCVCACVWGKKGDTCRFECMGTEHFPYSFKQTLPQGAVFGFWERQQSCYVMRRLLWNVTMLVWWKHLNVLFEDIIAEYCKITNCSVPYWT